jgi:hypothetical protein
MKPYVVKQGDYLLKIAHLSGFDADEVWGHAKNADLRTARKDASMLKAGDVLFVPDEPKKRLGVTLKQGNTYVARLPTVKIGVVVVTDGEAVANEKYIVEGIGDESERTTDGDGRVSMEVPVHVREVTVRFIDRPLLLHVPIGDLDPPDTPSGARMRLTSLGYYGATLAGADQYEAHDDAALESALRSFQKASGVGPTGKLDAATIAALVSAHGS